MAQTTKVEVGDLYEVSSNELWSTGQSNNVNASDDYGRSVKGMVNFKLGEIIEIRYPYQWHIRTIDNKYFHITPEDLSTKCKPYGKIKKDTRWQNKADLKEILDEKLYDDAVLCVVVEK